MQILNVRLGLATNSSSAHSLIFLPAGVKAQDYMGSRQSIGDGQQLNEIGDFGWQRFTVASREGKLRYLGVLLRDRLGELLPENVANLVLRSWLDDVHVEEDDYIDHQSWFYLPSAFGTKIPDEQFVRELKAYFLQEQLVILGGNDNEEVQHPLKDHTAFVLPVPQDVGLKCNFVCRYDEEYKFWCIFNPEDGTKIRFRFTNNPDEFMTVPQKASTPELVDVKITDLCPYGCKYCYQDSTANGTHADCWQLFQLARELAYLKVFEVSLGGGEPTLHPDFFRVLECFREMGIVPNFTTRNINWLRHPAHAHRIVEATGAFALSVHKPDEVKELATLLDYNEIPHSKAAVQVVLGTIDMWELASILKNANDACLRTTLLSYKTTGRGVDFQPTPYENWLDLVKQASEHRNWGAGISVDTALARDFETQILAAGVPGWLFSTKEGSFSCYIDMVTKTMGPSSFCPPEQMRSIVEDTNYDSPNFEPRMEMIRRIFKEFNP